MNKCKLCNFNVAKKKGSHIVPHFLLKRIENINGKSGRDYELGFSITKNKSSSHFGRSLQPEKLEEVYGEITQEDIDKNQNPNVVDHFFCNSCEDRLGIIESLYANTINTVKNDEYESGVSSSTGMLFWGSILWRMSINRKCGVSLKAEENEFFREMLDSCLPLNNSGFDSTHIINHKSVKSISYKILRCSEVDEDDSKWLIFHPDFYTPLCLLIDEFVILYSLNSTFKDLETVDCFGLNKCIESAQINISNNPEIIRPFINIIYKTAAEKIVIRTKETYVEGLYELCDELHSKTGALGGGMPDNIKEEFIAEIVTKEEKLGRRYNQEEIIKTLIEVAKKYYPILNQ